MVFKLKLHWQVLIALALAVVVGLAITEETTWFGVNLVAVFGFVGKLFLNALKMIIVPLVVSSIIVSIAGIGADSGLGRLGAKTILYYATTSLVAILVGLFFVNMLHPGVINGVPAKEVLGLNADVSSIAANAEGRAAADVWDIFQRMIPVNVVAAAAEGQMLGLIFFAILFGYFMTHIERGPARAMRDFWQGVYEVMILITEWVMKFAPVGVFALVTKVIAGTGLDAFEALGWFVAAVVLALAVHMLVVMPAILFLVARVNPIKHYKAMAPALITAFSTSSSSATLPVSMDCVEKNAGVSNRTTSFVLPLGATVNMDGTALYECVAAMFIAQAYGLDMTFGMQFIVVLTALLTSIGVAGVPSASLVAIVVILSAVGLPAEGVGLILAVDRILDMMRTAVNIFSDSCGAVVIACSEGEKTALVNGD